MIDRWAQENALGDCYDVRRRRMRSARGGRKRADPVDRHTEIQLPNTVMCERR